MVSIRREKYIPLRRVKIETMEKIFAAFTSRPLAGPVKTSIVNVNRGARNCTTNADKC